MSSLDEILENFNRLLKIQYKLAKSSTDSIQTKDATGTITTVDRQSFDQLVGNVYQQIRKLTTIRKELEFRGKLVISGTDPTKETQFYPTLDDPYTVIKGIFKDIRQIFENSVGDTPEDYIGYYGNVEDADRILKAYQDLEDKWLAYDFNVPVYGTDSSGRHVSINPIPETLKILKNVGLEFSRSFTDPDGFLIAVEDWTSYDNHYYLVLTEMEGEVIIHEH